VSDTTEVLVPVSVFIYRLRYRSGTVNAFCEAADAKEEPPE